MKRRQFYHFLLFISNTSRKKRREIKCNKNNRYSLQIEGKHFSLLLSAFSLSLFLVRLFSFFFFYSNTKRKLFKQCLAFFSILLGDERSQCLYTDHGSLWNAIFKISDSMFVRIQLIGHHRRNELIGMRVYFVRKKVEIELNVETDWCSNDENK